MNTNTIFVWQFLGLVLYHRQSYSSFLWNCCTAACSNTKKGVPLNWSAECAEAFTALKDHLTQAPVLGYPQFDLNAGTFHLQTDASGFCVKAEWPSSGLCKSRSYIPWKTICCHTKWMSRNNVCPKPIPNYLLGGPFQNLDRSCPTAVAIHTKMEGILCRWALAIQEYVLKLYTAKDHSMPMQMHFLIVQLQMTHLCCYPGYATLLHVRVL